MTKLTQNNVISNYQTGKSYASGEMLIYNGVPSYANIAIPNGTTAVASNFSKLFSNAMRIIRITTQTYTVTPSDADGNTALYIEYTGAGNPTITLSSDLTKPITIFNFSHPKTLNITWSGSYPVGGMGSTSPFVIFGFEGIRAYPYKNDGTQYYQIEWVDRKRYSSNIFLIYEYSDTTKAFYFDGSGIGTGQIRSITIPDKNVNLGDISSIATTNGNSLGGTRNNIIGGSNNTVSGTDIVAIDCSNNTIGGTGVTYMSTYNTGGIVQHIQIKGTTVLGSSLHPLIVIFDGQSGYGGALATTVGLSTISLSANGTTNNITTDTGAPANTNTPMLVSGYEVGASRFASIGSAVHDVDFIVTFGVNAPLEPSRTFYAKRRVYAAYHTISGTPTWATSTEVVGTDTNLGAVVGTVTIGFTLDTANNRLVPTIAATGGQNYQVSARVNSHYNRK